MGLLNELFILATNKLKEVMNKSEVTQDIKPTSNVATNKEVGDFLAGFGDKHQDVLNPVSTHSLDRAKFYAEYKKVFRSIKQSNVDCLEAIFDIFDRYYEDIKDTEKKAYMLATVRHEVGPDMIPIEENMNYTAGRICQVWPSRFKSAAEAAPYAHNPEKLANNVYGNRLGNGPPSSGDGYRYRGRGIGAQFTGKVNYIKFGKLFGVDLVNNPKLAVDLNLGAKILYKGSIEGLFTGRSLSHYITKDKTDYINARRVVNADVAANGSKIARDAEKFYNILTKVRIS